MELLFDNAIQFQAKNGTLLTSGRVYVYYLGRTELAPVYSGYSGETPISNPVMLDAEGRGSIYVDPAFSYTYVVTDRFGKEQFSIDKEFPAGIPTEGTYVTRIVEGDYIKVEETGDRAKTVTVGVDDTAKDILDNAASRDYVDDAAAAAKTTLEEGNNIKLNLDVKEDGHFEYTINAKNIDVTSPNGTITVNVVDDPLTDTKTFQLDIGSGNVEYFFGKSANIQVTDNRQYELVSLANQGVQGNLNPANLKKGIYLMCASIKYRPVSNTNDMQRVFINAGYPAIQHYDVLDMSYTDYHTKELAQLLIIPNDGIAATIYFQFEGMTDPGREVGVELYNVSIYRIDTVLANGGEIITGLTEVIHDGTLTGKGTIEDPLSVTNPGGASYGAGDAIDIDANDDINVLYGDGLAINGDNELEVQLGDGLTFGDDGGIKVITIDSDVSDVVKTVEKLKKDLDTQITTNFDMPNISQVYDFADGSNWRTHNGACMLCQSFTIPINHEIRTVTDDADTPTLLGVYAKQAFGNKVMLALYEYTYPLTGEANGTTTYVGDTGPVTILGGLNEYPLKNKNPSIDELRSDKVYYATLYMPSTAFSNGLFLAGAPNYGSTSVPAEPRLTCVTENITWENVEIDLNDPTATLNHYQTVIVPGEDPYYQYYIGPWTDGYNERWETPRFYMQLRNGEYNTPIIPAVPFTDLGAQLPDTAGLVSTIPSFNPSSSNSIYRNVEPLTNVSIASMEWIDNTAVCNGWAAANCVYDSGYTSNLSGVSNTVTDLGQVVTVDGQAGYAHRITFTSPVALTAGTMYRFLCDTFTSGSEYSFTWASPTNVLDCSNNGWYADYQNMTRLNNYYGKYLKLTDTNNVSYVI